MRYGSSDYAYTLVEEWAQLPAGYSFRDVCGIAVDRLDRVYVLNRGTRPVMVFDRDGRFQSSWGEGYFTRAHGSGIGADDVIYCTDDQNHTVTKFDLAGHVLMVLGAQYQPSDTGYQPGPDLFQSLASITHGGPPFNRPTGVALASDGSIFVADGYGNARVHRFQPDGALIRSWGSPGTAPGQFRLPHSIRVDRRDRVWVPDRENNRIQIFTADGDFITQWTNVTRPTDLCIDDADVVYVSELPQRISIFTMDGALVARWGNEGHDAQNPLFIAPHAIAIDSHGDLYVGEVAMTTAKVDRGSRTIQKFQRVT